MNPSTEAYVCVIGAAGVDLAGHSRVAVRPQESNPGSLHVSWGGVGRNIAENLARLEVPVHLVTVLADDGYGQQLLQHAQASGVRMEARMIVGGTSPCYLSVIDPHGELVVAISAMDLLDELTEEYVREKEVIIRNAAMCVIDTNLNPDVLHYLFSHFPHTVFCADVVSLAKADKLLPWLGRISLLKPNRAEAEHLSGIRITDKNSRCNVADFFLKKGVKQVLISQGRDGLFYSDGHQQGMLVAGGKTKSVSTTGAGDAMMAGLIYARFQGMDLAQSAHVAMAASAVALEHRDTVNPNISPSTLNRAQERIHDV